MQTQSDGGESLWSGAWQSNWCLSSRHCRLLAPLLLRPVNTAQRYSTSQRSALFTSAQRAFPQSFSMLQPFNSCSPEYQCSAGAARAADRVRRGCIWSQVQAVLPLGIMLAMEPEQNYVWDPTSHNDHNHFLIGGYRNIVWWWDEQQTRETTPGQLSKEQYQYSFIFRPRSIIRQTQQTV